MLVRINGAKGDTYEIAEVVVNTQNANRNSIKLKSGREYVLRADEAQRVVDAIRKLDNQKLGLE